MTDDLLSAKETENLVRAMIHLYPQSDSDLHYRNHFELVCAVMLSAQTTDIAVNKVTPALFAAFPTPEAMMAADITEIEDKIKTIGLYRNKAKFLRGAATKLVEDYHSEVPHTQTELMTLPGVGRKTANVVLSVGFDQPTFPVDTHISRVTQKFNMVPEGATPNQIEKIMKEKLPKELWSQAHLSVLHFGRYQCIARKHNHEGCIHHLEVAKQELGLNNDENQK